MANALQLIGTQYYFIFALNSLSKNNFTNRQLFHKNRQMVIIRAVLQIVYFYNLRVVIKTSRTVLPSIVLFIQQPNAACTKTSAQTNAACTKKLSVRVLIEVCKF